MIVADNAIANRKYSTFGFKLKTNMKFGVGISAGVGDQIREAGFSRIGVILDSGITGLSVTSEMLSGMKKSSIECEIFQNDHAEPDYDYLEEYKKQFLGRDFDALMGVGGGSTLDLTKGVATLVTNPGPAIEYRGFPRLKNKPLPVIAIPTTAGTGSEATYNAVFTDTKEKKKLGINSEYNYPVLAILDPLFVKDCPRNVAISAGMDALTHTLESFVHRNHTPLSRMYSKEAFRLLFNNLRRIPDESHDVDMWSKLQLGSYLAGIALINAGSGPSGALSYPLGVHYKVPHGMAGAVFLTSVVEFNVKNGYRDYAELYDLIDGVDKDAGVAEKNRSFVEHMRLLDRAMGIPTLAYLELQQDDVRFMTEQYDMLKNAIAQNPVPMMKEDVAVILNKISQERNIEDAGI